jgi:hypothetical protein
VMRTANLAGLASSTLLHTRCARAGTKRVLHEQ